MNIPEISGGAAAGVVITIIFKWGKEILSFLVSGKEIGIFHFGKNGNGKLTKKDHAIICRGNLEIIVKDIALHTQRLEQGEKKFVELREDQRKDFEILHDDIMSILERGQK